MQIHSTSRITWPREAVFRAYRDNLADVAAYIPDIREIVVRSRQEDGAVVRLHNEWVADREIPAVAAAYVKPEHLRWDDFADWDEAAYRCAYRLRTHAFTEAVACAGHNTFYARGPRETEVVLTGELTVDLKKVRAVPRLLAGRLAPTVERFIVSLITPNLERVNAALQQYLDATEA